MKTSAELSVAFRTEEILEEFVSLARPDYVDYGMSIIDKRSGGWSKTYWVELKRDPERHASRREVNKRASRRYRAKLKADAAKYKRYRTRSNERRRKSREKKSRKEDDNG